MVNKNNQLMNIIIAPWAWLAKKSAHRLFCLTSLQNPFYFFLPKMFFFHILIIIPFSQDELQHTDEPPYTPSTLHPSPTIVVFQNIVSHP